MDLRRFEFLDSLGSSATTEDVRLALTDIASELEPRPGLAMSVRDFSDLSSALKVGARRTHDLAELALGSPQVALQEDHCTDPSDTQWSARHWKPVKALWSSPRNDEYRSLWEYIISERGDIHRSYSYKVDVCDPTGMKPLILADYRSAVSWIDGSIFQDRVSDLRLKGNYSRVLFTSLLVAQAEAAVVEGTLTRGEFPSGIGCESSLWLAAPVVIEEEVIS